MTGRTEVGHASFKLSQLAADGTADVWLPVESSMPGAPPSPSLPQPPPVSWPRPVRTATRWPSALPWLPLVSWINLCPRTRPHPPNHPTTITCSALINLPTHGPPPRAAGERTQGAVRLSISYKQFQEDEVDSGGWHPPPVHPRLCPTSLGPPWPSPGHRRRKSPPASPQHAPTPIPASAAPR